ncbi:hypothetical protein DJ568_15410 [Mucilaginibacter hurinus]|uniref:Uncharacterized protein n=2 Tax=Mucilaginibacter hurinus TaxID=2201324 RepID=A0A367GLM4_9SPHI|nr:hypothetical protein DJ568_15410 [Mucilaginibacter hurinus]
MNYILLINNFWRIHEGDPVGTVAGYLYFHLLDVCNKQNWRNPFKRQNTRVCGDIGITSPTLLKARNELKQRGLIDFKSRGKGDSNVMYRLLLPQVRYESNNDNNFTTSFDTSFTAGFTTCYNLSNTKTENENLLADEHDRLRRAELTFEIEAFNQTQSVLKEKGCAQKEKEPAVADAAGVFSRMYTSKWQLCLRNPITATPEARLQKFNLFWEMNVDDWRLRGFPAWGEMLNHFFNWIPAHQAKSRKAERPAGNAPGVTRGTGAVINAFTKNTYKGN